MSGLGQQRRENFRVIAVGDRFPMGFAFGKQLFQIIRFLFGNSDDGIGLAYEPPLQPSLQPLPPTGQPLTQHIAMPQVAIIHHPGNPVLLLDPCADETGAERWQAGVDQVDVLFPANPVGDSEAFKRPEIVVIGNING